jgi:hypothetical protein
MALHPRSPDLSFLVKIGNSLPEILHHYLKSSWKSFSGNLWKNWELRGIKRFFGEGIRKRKNTYK